MKRQIVHIDEDKCDGCGLCVPSCAEGAIQIIDEKAKLVSDVYCDGLGACLGDCPNDAISIIERDADEFDEAAAIKHVASIQKDDAPKAHGCPGSAPRTLSPVGQSSAPAAKVPSALTNWPVQLHLVPIEAPFYDKAKLFIAADCVPTAHPGFHQEMLAGKALIIGCPKLDDTDLYWRKLGQIFMRNDIESIDVAIMEVPCCNGLIQIIQQAMGESGKQIPVTITQVGIKGEILGTRPLDPPSSKPRSLPMM